jgi:DNA-binding CsgD family transcriptional regulator
MKGWEAETRMRDGQVSVEFTDGQRIVVKNDGITGFDFVVKYLQCMEEHYGAHLIAIDQILQRDLADDYKAVKAIPNVYKAHLAVQSMNCVFGRCDEVLDCDPQGELHMEFTHCPRRATCRFNGYNEKYKSKLIVGCNPIYECGLTPSQARLADLMVNTPMQEAEIAETLCVSIQTVKNTRKAVFAILGVSSRPELIQKLKGKRLS